MSRHFVPQVHPLLDRARTIAASRRPSRRSLLVAGCATALALAVDAYVLEPRWLQVEHREIPIDGLGAGWHGATIALLSDTHRGPFVPRSYIEEAVALTNTLRPDVVLLLGDYVHGSSRYVAPGIAPFSHLRARHGVYAVLGNHDHWNGRDRSLTQLHHAGIPVLINRSTVLMRNGDPLRIAGVGDLMEGIQLPHRAMRGAHPNAPRILMSHNPDYAELLPPDVRVDLMVCGHTHGGQVQIPGYGAPVLPSRYGKKYQQGLVHGPHCRVYVTRGVGTISPAVRFLCRPEVTLIRLVSRNPLERKAASTTGTACKPDPPFPLA